VEQTRNTLLFACCAKEVTTKAQINVVMSDKALVKQLQRELARLESELRNPAPATSSCDCGVTLRKKDLQIQKVCAFGKTQKLFPQIFWHELVDFCLVGFILIKL